MILLRTSDADGKVQSENDMFYLECKHCVNAYFQSEVFVNSWKNWAVGRF